MATSTLNAIPSIRTLPLSDLAQGLFSRAVRIVQRKPSDFAPVASWLTKHYSEAVLATKCERKYRQEFAYRLRLLRRDSPTYNRRLAIQQGRKWEELAWETINEALYRGRRLLEDRPVSRQDRRGVTVDENNVHLVWRWEDGEYRRQFREIKAERKTAKLLEDDRPDRLVWRLRRVVDELVEAEYPDGDRHVEHSRKIVAIAALLMPEPLPTLGEMGSWTFANTLCLPDKPTGSWIDDVIAADCKAAEDGPFGVSPGLMIPRIVGREEVMFQRMPGEAREIASWFPLEALLGLLGVAVDELESEQAKGGAGKADVGLSERAIQREGPVVPTSFWYNGRATDLSPLEWKLVSHLWSAGNRTSAVGVIERAVWGDESENDHRMKSAAKRASGKLQIIGLEISRKNDYYTLKSV